MFSKVMKKAKDGIAEANSKLKGGIAEANTKLNKQSTTNATPPNPTSTSSTPTSSTDAFNPQAPPPTEPSALPPLELKPGEELFHGKHHPSYKPYFKQILTGVPRSTVEASMKMKKLNISVLDNPNMKVVYRSKKAAKKSAMDVLYEEEARQAVLLEEEEAEIMAEYMSNPLANIDWNKPEFQGLIGGARKAYTYVKKRQEHITQKAFAYGPPYVVEYGGNLLEECNRANASTLDVHQMLLDGADPGIPDAPKNFSNTALHYACRYAHRNIAKMLIRAKAKHDKVNDLGITPLATLCMFNQPPGKHSQHIAMVKWILALGGAQVNNVDKGGHTALEFAARHGNIDLVVLLLKHSARVKRNAEFISLTSIDLLSPDNCTDPTCLALITAKYNEELRVERVEKERIRHEKEVEDIKEWEAQRLQEILNARSRRDRDGSAGSSKKAYDLAVSVEIIKKKNREEGLRKRLSLAEEKRNENGTWVRKVRGRDRDDDDDDDDDDDEKMTIQTQTQTTVSEWNFIDGVKQLGKISGGAYDDAVFEMNDMKVRTGHDLKNRRWKELTGHDLLTLKDVSDMRYGIGEVSKEERERLEDEEEDEEEEEEEEEAREALKEGNGGGKKKKVGVKAVVYEAKLRTGMSVTGQRLKALPTPFLN